MDKDENLPAATGAYAPALRVGDWIFVSGQGPIDAEGAIVAGDLASEVGLTLENVRRLVEAAGGRVEHIVKCTCYLADIREFEAFDRAYRAFFDGVLPTRTTIGAVLDGIRIEIDAMAFLGDGERRVIA